MPVETLTYVYTTVGEMQRLFTIAGVNDRVEDSDEITDAIEEATDEINTACLGYYNAADLADNKFVRRMATYLACHALSGHAAEPTLFNQQVEKYQRLLEEIKMGKTFIPRLKTRNSNHSPTMSNLVVDDRYATNKLRVNPVTSVGDTYSGQALDYYNFYAP